MHNGVPVFLDQLIAQLQLMTSEGGAIERHLARGRAAGAEGFTVSQVVHSYGDVCQVVTQLADETEAPITASEFELFNAASTTRSPTRSRVSASARRVGGERRRRASGGPGARAQSPEYSDVVVHHPSTGDGGDQRERRAVLGRSLRGMRDLINSTLTRGAPRGRALRGSTAGSRWPSSSRIRRWRPTWARPRRAITLIVTPVAPDIHVEV